MSTISQVQLFCAHVLILHQPEWWWPVRCNASRMCVSYCRWLCRVNPPSLPAFPDGSSFSSVLSRGPIRSERPTQLLNRPLKSSSNQNRRMKAEIPLEKKNKKKRLVSIKTINTNKIKNTKSHTIVIEKSSW